MNNQTIQAVLEGLADAMESKLMPALGDDPFALEQARLANRLLGIAAQKVDGLAAVRIAENAEMRALFADAAALVGGDLAGALAEAAKGGEPGFRISELDVENGRLRGLLVRLHASLEDDGGSEALAMHQRIWRLLRDMEERRRT